MIDKSGLLFSVPGLDVVLLKEVSAPELQSLLERCSDYFLMVEGRRPKKNAAVKEFHDVPPGFAKANLRCLGLRRVGGVLAGVLIALQNYPQENQWYISLFLLDPGWRGRLTGRNCYLAFEEWVKSQNAEAILLAVVAPNERAAKFWESVGFGLPRCYPAARFGLKRHVLIEYEKSLIG